MNKFIKSFIQLLIFLAVSSTVTGMNLSKMLERREGLRNKLKKSSSWDYLEHPAKRERRLLLTHATSKSLHKKAGRKRSKHVARNLKPVKPRYLLQNTGFRRTKDVKSNDKNIQNKSKNTKALKQNVPNPKKMETEVRKLKTMKKQEAISKNINKANNKIGHVNKKARTVAMKKEDRKNLRMLLDDIEPNKSKRGLFNVYRNNKKKNKKAHKKAHKKKHKKVHKKAHKKKHKKAHKKAHKKKHIKMKKTRKLTQLPSANSFYERQIRGYNSKRY